METDEERPVTYRWHKKKKGGGEILKNKKEAGSVVSGDSVPGRRGGFSTETYRFQTLDGVLTDVHAPGLFHLHVAQVLQGSEGERTREKMESCRGAPVHIPKRNSSSTITFGVGLENEARLSNVSCIAAVI